MSNIDELPSWAGRAVETGTVPAPPPKKRSKLKALLLGLLGLGVLAAVAAGAYWLADRNSDDNVATDAATTTTVEETAAGGEDDQVGTETTVEAQPTTSTTEAATSSTTEAPTDDAAGDGASADGELTLPADYSPSDPLFDERVDENTRYTVIRQGQVYLYGFVPTEEIRDQITEIAGGVVGPDNVFTETIIDPDAPVPPDAPVFVDDKVLFAFNSVEIDPAFIPILELGVLLLSQNPTAEITVVSRTDAVGSEEVNLDVSRRRAQAVVDYWVGRGVDTDRVMIDARGEQDASEDDDETTAALNRSVEFRISGLFSGG